MKRPVLVFIGLAFLLAMAVGWRVCQDILDQGQYGLYIIGLDGSGLRRLVDGDAGLVGWLDDNTALIEYGEKLKALDIDSGQTRTALKLNDRFIDYKLSPNGQRIAYLALSEQLGEREWAAALHVTKVDGSDDRILAEGGGLN